MSKDKNKKSGEASKSNSVESKDYITYLESARKDGKTEDYFLAFLFLYDKFLDIEDLLNQPIEYVTQIDGIDSVDLFEDLIDEFWVVFKKKSSQRKDRINAYLFFLDTCKFIFKKDKNNESKYFRLYQKAFHIYYEIAISLINDSEHPNIIKDISDNSYFLSEYFAEKGILDKKNYYLKLAIKACDWECALNYSLDLLSEGKKMKEAVDMAKLALKFCAKYKPEDYSKTFYYAIYVISNCNRVSEAYKMLQAVGDKVDTDFWYLLAKALIYKDEFFKNRDVELAIGCYQKALEIEDDSGLYYDIADLYFDQKKNTEALDYLQKGLNKKSLQCANRIFRFYLRNGSNKEKKDVAKKIEKILNDPTFRKEEDYCSPESLLLLGHYYADYGDFDKAFMCFNESCVPTKDKTLALAKLYLNPKWAGFNIETGVKHLEESAYKYANYDAFYELASLISDGTVSYDKTCVEVLEDSIEISGYYYSAYDMLFNAYFEGKYGCSEDVHKAFDLFVRFSFCTFSNFVDYDEKTMLFINRYSELNDNELKKLFETVERLAKNNQCRKYILALLYEKGITPNLKADVNKAYQVCVRSARENGDGNDYCWACDFLLTHNVPGKTNRDAFNIIKEAIDKKMIHTGIYRRYADFLSGRYRISRLFKTDCQKAIEYYKLSLKELDSNAKAHTGLAYCYYKLDKDKDFEEGRDHYLLALKYDYEDNKKELQVLKAYYDADSNQNNPIADLAEAIFDKSTWAERLKYIDSELKRHISKSVLSILKNEIRYSVPLQKGIKNYLDNLENYEEMELPLFRDYSDTTNQIAKTYEGIVEKYYYNGYKQYSETQSQPLDDREFSLGSVKHFYINKKQDDANLSLKDEQYGLRLKPMLLEYLKLVMNKRYIRKHIKLTDENIDTYFARMFVTISDFAEIRNEGAHTEIITREDAEQLINLSIFENGLIERLLLSIDFSKAARYISEK